jgi:hypothetical protein
LKKVIEAPDENKEVREKAEASLRKLVP